MLTLCFGSFANMELARVLALVCMIAGPQLVRATPHGYGGYGVKVGAAAKAQAAAGAFAGAGAVPVPFPLSGAGYSGSYSKSSSSSFASSGASSSSSSFSFGGSGIPGIGGGCTTCPNTQANNGNHATNGNANDFYSNNGASSTNGADAAQAGFLAGSQYYPKGSYESPCSGNNCNQKGIDCKGPDCNDFSSSPNKCESGQCEPTSSGPSGSNTDDKDNKCPYGQCGAGVTSNAQVTNSANGNNNLNSGNSYSAKCTSGDCKTNGGPEISSPSYNPSDKDAPGQFESTPGVPTGYGSNVSPNKCTSGKCESRGDVPTDYGSDNPNKCAHGQCGGLGDKPNFGLNANPNNCKTGQCEPNSAEDAPYDKSKKCTSGQCNLTPTANVPSENGDDIPVNFAGSPNYGSVHPNGKFNAPSGPGIFPTSKPAVTSPYSTTNTKPSYSNQNKGTPICTSSNCNNDAYNPHASASGSASAPTYNWPVPFLTAPKESSSCTSPNCQRPNVATIEYPYGYIVPGAKPSHGSSPGVSGHYPSSSIVPGTHSTTGSYSSAPGTYPSNPSAAYPSAPSSSPVCAGGNCANPQYSPSNSGYGSSGSKCTTPNCAFNSPQIPSSHILTPNVGPNYNNQNNILHAPTSPGSPLTPSQGYNPSSKPFSGFGAPTRPISQNDVSTSTYPQGTIHTRPNYSSDLPTVPTTPESNNPNDDGSIPPFVPLGTSKSPNCIGNSCSGVTNQPSYGQSSIPTHPAQVNPANYGHNSVSTHPGPINPGTRPTNGQYGHDSVPSHSGPAHSGHPTSPSSATYPGLHSTASSNAGAHPDKPEKPYLGGFGGPSGLLKPNEFNIPSNTLTSNNNKPSTGVQSSVLSSGSPPCSTGSCSSQPNPSPPGYGGASNPIANQDGTHYSASCTTGKCRSPSEPSGNFNLNGAHAAAGASVPSPGSPPCLSGNCSPQPNPSYPGHGGASSSIANLEGTHNSGPCTKGKCGSPSELSGSFNLNGANAAAGASVPSPGSPPCSSGNCGPQHNPSSPGHGEASNPYSSQEEKHNSGTCTTGKCGSPNGPSGSFNLNGAHAAAGASVLSPGSPPCLSGNCGPQPNPSSPGHGEASNPIANQEGTHTSGTCTTGKCGSPNGPSGSLNLNGANAAAGAVASASAGAYLGGFGGPPGLLTPFDNGKLDGSVPNKIGGFPTGTSGQSLTNVGHSTYHDGAGGGTHAGAGTQATAVAGASAGAISGSPYGHGASGGCSGGCEGGGSYGGGRSLDNAPSHLKDSLDGLYGAVGAAVAGAKAGAASFGSSFASAHASAGAAVKGGHYGRR